MCGILGIVAKTPVNQLLYDGLLLLQHRGQDAAGIVTSEHKAFHMHKGPGMVRDVFRTRNMRSLPGEVGIGHCRYPTAGSAFNAGEAQPFYVNSPFGIVLGHNGNLTNSEALKQEMFRQDLRHINTNSDSEVLLNVLAHELELAAKGQKLDPETIFAAVANVHRRCRGAYAVVALIAGYGLLAFRDPYGIRPLVFGRSHTDQGPEYLVASESVALTAFGFELVRDVLPGEAIFIDESGTFNSRQCAAKPVLAPCIFEYVYLARPDSVMEAVSVYERRLQMAREAGANKVFFASAGPAVRFPNVYGIDMPTRTELIATGRTDEQIAREIGADAVIYQDLDALKAAVRAVNPKLTQFETSCFDGVYITGDVTSEYLASIERQRASRQESEEDAENNQLDLNAA